MKEINDIKSTDLKALEQLDKDCIDLHLFPPPKTFIQMDIEGPNGEKIESRKMRSQSWHRNAYNLIASMMAGLSHNAGGATYGSGALGLKDVDSSPLTPAALYLPGIDGPVGGAGITKKGIAVGFSGAAEEFNDFTLMARAINGTALGFSLGCVYDSWSYVTAITVNAAKNRMALSTQYSPYIKLYSVDENNRVRDMKTTFVSGAPTDSVATAAWSPDGIYLAYWQNNISTIKVLKYDATANSLTQVASLGVGSPQGSGANEPLFEWSPDGSRIAVSGNSPRLIKNNGDDTFTMASVVGESSYAAAWSPDGKYVAFTVAASPFLRLYKKNEDLSLTPITIATAPAAKLTTPTWSPDGKYLFCGMIGAPYYYVVKKTGVDAFEKANASVSGVSFSSQVNAVFSEDSKYLIYGAGNYSQLGLLKNNNDDTFTHISTTAISGTSSAYAYAPQRLNDDGFVFHCTTQDSYKIVKLSPMLSFSAQTPTVVSYDAGGKKMSIVMQRVINNNSSVEAKIREIGLTSLLKDTSYHIMLSRDVLAEPLIVPPAYKLTVTYTMEMTFPA